MESSTGAADVAAEEIVDTLQQLSSTDLETLLSSLKQSLINALPHFLIAVIVFLIGFILIRLTIKFTAQMLLRSKSDPTLHRFVLSASRIGLYLLLSVIVLSFLIPRAVSGLIAALSIFGLAISLAVKDSLANLAGGISLLFTKPFGQGDFVAIDAFEGTVQEIRLNYTMLTTIDNKTIHIPNGDVAKSRIINFTSQASRRLDLNFSIGYHSNFEQAKQLVSELLDMHSMVINDPPPIVRVMELGESAVIIGCRVWVSTENYWPLKYDLLEQVKTAFDTAGISIPFNQLDVTLKSSDMV